MKRKIFLFVLCSAFLNTLFANEVKVVNVKAKCDENRVCTFYVTLKHKDTGWEHYANKWEIYTPSKKLIAKRILHHPHVDEQPFTRSLSGVKIPKGLKEVVIKGHDLAHGYSSDEFIYKF